MGARSRQLSSMDDDTRLTLIAESVLYCQRVQSMGMPSSCYTKALREPVYFLWEARGNPKHKAAKFRSTAAAGLRFGKREMVYDHAVPFRYLQNDLLALDPVDPASLRQVLERFGVAALITTDEDSRLKALGFQHTMPQDWDGLDVLARYRAAGVELEENPTWWAKR